jgi:hypothetical protein
VTVEIDPRTIPELEAILRTKGMWAKVRQLDVVCEQSHRLVEVLQIPGRGRLALGVDTSIVHGADTARKWRWVPVAKDQYGMDRDGRWLGLWVDEPDIEIQTVNGRRLHNRFRFTCRGGRCSAQITLPWLREQLALGSRRIVYTLR